MTSDTQSYLNKLNEIQNFNLSTVFTQTPAEQRFIIDSNTRTITVPSALKNIGVEHDHNAETIFFEINRFYDNEDLDSHICVIHYINAKGSPDVYPVTIKDLSTEGKIIFGWKISNHVTHLKGNITFAVRFYTLEEDGQHFAFTFCTSPASVGILAGFDVMSNASLIESDALSKAITKMNSTVESVKGIVDTLKTKAETAKATIDNAVLSTKMVYKEPVSTFAELSTKYPTVETGWVSKVLGDGNIYRFEDGEWKWKDTVSLSTYDALFQSVTTQLCKAATKSDLEIERERINNLIVNPGDGTIPTELIDLRVGADGVTYQSVGDASRKQFKKVKEYLNNISRQSGNLLDSSRTISNKRIYSWNNNQTLSNCVQGDAVGWFIFNTVDVVSGDIIYFLQDITKTQVFTNIFKTDGTLSRYTNIPVTGLQITDGEKYVVVNYHPTTNTLTGKEQIKKSTSDLTIYENYGVIPLISLDEKDAIKNSIREASNQIDSFYVQHLVLDVQDGLYNSLNLSESYNNNAAYKRYKIAVKEGENYYISATNINCYNFRAFIVTDNAGTILYTYNGTITNEKLDSYNYVIPTNGAYLYINSIATNGISLVRINKNRFNEIEYNINNINSDIPKTQIELDKTIKRVMIREYRNPFVYSKPPTGIITFTFDDGRRDVDKVAAIFAEYKIPLCLAIPPDTLAFTCTGLTSTNGDFTVGMKVVDVAKKVVVNGGEVLSHSWTPITKDNLSDSALLETTFTTNKQLLESAGFTIRGIAMAGGTNSLTGGTIDQGGEVFQYWAGQNFDYSDRYGITEDFYCIRDNMNTAVDSVITKIADSKTNKTWKRFFCHTLDGTESYLNEATLRQILQYCVDNAIVVKPWSYVYDNYKSTRLDEKIKTIETLLKI